MCLALWVVAFFTCSLHCTVGIVSAKASGSAHACCTEQGAAGKSDSAPVNKTGCHTFRDLTPADAPSVRADLTSHFVAVLVPALLQALTEPALTIAAPIAPEPDIGPPSHIPLMRLAGRAPPALV